MVIPTFYRRTRMAHELLERLKARFPKELAHTVLGYHVKIDEAQSRGQSIFEYAPADRARRPSRRSPRSSSCARPTPEAHA